MYSGYVEYKRGQIYSDLFFLFATKLLP